MWVKVFKEEKGDEPKDKIYYHTDHLGTVMMLTDERGKKAAEYEYSPFGEILGAKGERAKKNFYLFTGREYLSRLGMFDFRARVYDARVGRFIQIDPIQQNFLLYLYSGNNPVRFVDRTGLYFDLQRSNLKRVLSGKIKYPKVSHYPDEKVGDYPADIIVSALGNLYSCYKSVQKGEKDLSTCMSNFTNKLYEFLEDDIKEERQVFRGKISTRTLRRSTMDKMANLVETTSLTIVRSFVATINVSVSLHPAIGVYVGWAGLVSATLSAYAGAVVALRDWWIPWWLWGAWNAWKQSYYYYSDLVGYLLNVKYYTEWRAKQGCSIFSTSYCGLFWLIMYLLIRIKNE